VVRYWCGTPMNAAAKRRQPRRGEAFGRIIPPSPPLNVKREPVGSFFTPVQNTFEPEKYIKVVRYWCGTPMNAAAKRR